MPEMTVKKRLIFYCFFLVLFVPLQGCSDDKEVSMRKESSGYKGTVDSWRAFLLCWKNDIQSNINANRESFTEKQIDLLKHHLLRDKPRATKQLISEAENRLGVELPKSYRDFLRVTNGWVVDFHAGEAQNKFLIIEEKILAVQDIDWIMEKEAETVFAWEQGVGINKVDVNDETYFNYTSTQDPVDMRHQYLRSTIVISEEIDAGFFLLNPNVRFEDGEWETWYFSWELPGVLRFKSFAHLMRYAYYKMTQKPDGDFVYPEELLEKTCASSLPVDSDRNP